MSITRRDFLDGVALAIGAGITPASLALSGCSQPADRSQKSGGGYAEPAAGESAGPPYPPRLGGMRGSHDGAFEVAHRLRDGEKFAIADKPVEAVWDLVVVGSGISGLAAAWFWRRKHPDARVLLLDTHDDFGGHAKRNEFDAGGGKLLIGYGGTESLQSPGSLYSPVAKGLLKDLGIDIKRFETAFDRDHYPRRGMSRGQFFPKDVFGVDKLVTGSPLLGVADDLDAARLNARPLAAYLADFPLPEPARAQLIALFSEKRNFWPGKRAAAVQKLLDHMSYLDFLTQRWKVDPLVLACLRNGPCDFFAVGIDGISASDAFATNYPGFQGLALKRSAEAAAEMDEPYIYHFPDGNASIARLLVRALVPGVAPGKTMEDIVLAPFDYTKLDLPENPVAVRQGSTVVHLAQDGKPGLVDIGYVKDGVTRRVHAKACILACYNMMIPYLTKELEPAQVEALRRNVKGPLTYSNVLLRNWEAWDKLKVHSISNPAGFFSLVKLDYPVSLGGYAFSPDPSQPIVAHLVHVPTVPEAGPGLADKYRAARAKLFGMSFADFEVPVRDELARMLGDGGFQSERDILAITVNRWSHGYAYYPTPLYDHIDTKPWPEAIARRRFGRVAIANSDAGWSAYTHTAIDQAWRAVQELASA
ncbi:MAG: NAD(P)/FAD-dependent oxidoreductase [Sphingomonadales bacterium]|nr:NAD(P)/FAD-dependent oxidoreductase [Sphingomonadales bacterium]